MDKKEIITQIWQECFNDSDEYIEMYFNRVYRDDDALLLIKNDIPISSMLLQRYAMSFHGDVVNMGYIYGAGTRKQLRGNGYMSELMVDSLKTSFTRGDMLCSLIPANEWLYNYYSKFGFSTVFYINKERFTSQHKFHVNGKYHLINDVNPKTIYEQFHTLMKQRQCCVLHSYQDFLNIIEDNRLDNGKFITLGDSFNNIKSMAWAVIRNDELVVSDILACDNDARNAALSELQHQYPNHPIVILAHPQNEHRNNIQSRGMARIINVNQTLSLIASKHPNLNTSIKITDTIITENYHTYILNNGKCKTMDNFNGKIVLDIPINVFTSIVFGSNETANLLNFPSTRPFLSLMLD